LNRREHSAPSILERLIDGSGGECSGPARQLEHTRVPSDDPYWAQCWQRQDPAAVATGQRFDVKIVEIRAIVFI